MCRKAEVIADNLSKASWGYGCVSTLDSNGRTIWIADEKLTALMEPAASKARLYMKIRRGLTC